ncbi:thiamine diphosphokinase [uncultured Tateyamaria sp.]|uniref:thiamine diphosphokinase n=1 Tax=uncultured Tateyamaria sp. TaxID=455651 RepID=UPI002603EEF1|nr:thiamine diphosphokinase [uncultured Tateyamaria sp.]
MTKRIVHSFDPITLLGGGEASVADVMDAVALAPTCVAADGGAELADRADVALAAIIGDFDSVSPQTLARIPPDRQIKVSEQDSTDFDKALRHIEAPVVVAVGFTGGRVDHHLAVLHGLAARPERPCLVLGPSEITFLCPSDVTLPTEDGDTVSLFPLGPVGGVSEGLHWPIKGLRFDPATRIGTSNMATGPVILQMDAPGMLVILPRARLAGVIRALACVPQAARWPARETRYTDPPQP